MPKYPRIYAESTINRMYKKLGMPDETVELLHRYFQAISNFYELIPLRKVYEIINTQTGGNLPEEKFIAFSEIARHEEHFYYILGLEELYRDEPKSEPMDRLLINESLLIVDMEFFYQLDEAKYHKGDDYYVPAQKELLKYEDETYHEGSPYARALKTFLHKTAKMSRSKMEDFFGWLCHESQQPDFHFDSITDLIEFYELSLTTAQMERFLTLFNDFHNNQRMPANNGYTPSELLKKYGGGAPKSISLGPNITEAIKNGDTEMINAAKGMLDLAVLAPESRKLIEDALPKAQPAVKIKVGRNDPCPCGSGKKYKKCCGR